MPSEPGSPYQVDMTISHKIFRDSSAPNSSKMSKRKD